MNEILILNKSLVWDIFVTPKICIARLIYYLHSLSTNLKNAFEKMFWYRPSKLRC